MSLLPLVLIGLLQAGEPRFERLDDGLRLVIVEDHALPLVSVQLWYRVGSAYDPPSKPGLCSAVRAILEHRDDAALKLRAAGVRFESRTERDACYFSSVLPPNFLEYVLDIEAARMKPLTVSVELVERGLNAAALEYADAADDPNHVLMRHVLAAMFPDHPYQHPPGFVAESLKDLSTSEVNEFLQRWFVPGNATLLVIGDVSTVQVVEQVRQRFGKLPWAEPPRHAEPKHLEPETIRIAVEHTSRAGVTIAWRTPPLGYFENAAIDVLMHRLCNPVDGPLHDRVVELGCAPPRWRRTAWRHAGLLVLSIDASGVAAPPAAAALTQAVQEEVARAAESVPEEIEHNRARALAERQAWERVATFGRWAQHLATQEVVGGNMLLADLAIPQIRAVAVGDVQATTWLLDKARRVMLVCDGREADSSAQEAQPLMPALVGRQPQILEGSEALESLSRFAQSAPIPAAPGHAARVVSQTRGNLVRTAACVVPGYRRSSVMTTLSERDGPGDGWLMQEHPPVTAQDVSPSRALDYAAYHGIAWNPVLSSGAAPRSYGWQAAGAPDRMAAMIEWQRQLLPLRDGDGTAMESLADCRYAHVFTFGPNAAQDVFELVGEAWQDWEPPPPTATRPANVLASEPPYPGQDQRARSDGLVLRWKEAPHAEVWLSLSIRFPERATTGTPSELDLRCLELLLGRPPHGATSLDGRRLVRWCDWHRRWYGSVARAAVQEAELEKAVRDVWSRVLAIRRHRLPLEHVVNAIRLARTEYLVALDGPAAVLEALWRGELDPWAIDAAPRAEELLERLASPLQSATVQVTAWSSDRRVGVMMRELEEQLSAETSSREGEGREKDRP